MEEHHSVAQTMQAVVASLVFEGVLERFPELRVVIMEGGLGWVPSLVRAWTSTGRDFGARCLM